MKTKSVQVSFLFSCLPTATEEVRLIVAFHQKIHIRLVGKVREQPSEYFSRYLLAVCMNHHFWAQSSEHIGCSF